jgi:hypothetical protein
MLSQNRPWDLFSLLNVVDRRSLIRLLTRGDLIRLLDESRSPSIQEFLTAQRFLKSREVVHAVSRSLTTGHQS